MKRSITYYLSQNVIDLVGSSAQLEKILQSHFNLVPEREMENPMETLSCFLSIGNRELNEIQKETGWSKSYAIERAFAFQHDLPMVSQRPQMARRKVKRFAEHAFEAQFPKAWLPLLRSRPGHCGSDAGEALVKFHASGKWRSVPRGTNGAGLTIADVL